MRLHWNRCYMRVFLSAEVQNEVGEALRRAENKVRNLVVPKLASDYGPSVDVWVLITILRPRIPEGWGETHQYDPTRRAADFRLIIDYSAFKAASPREQVQMLVKSILRSIDLFPRLKVKGFDVDRFRRDIMDAAIAGGLVDSPPEGEKRAGSGWFAPPAIEIPLAVHDNPPPPAPSPWAVAGRSSSAASEPWPEASGDTSITAGAACCRVRATASSKGRLPESSPALSKASSIPWLLHRRHRSGCWRGSGGRRRHRRRCRPRNGPSFAGGPREAVWRRCRASCGTSPCPSNAAARRLGT